ncbi:anion exchange family protein [Arthroderma uncinatum]|uniref:anion exchange family protein n=1 Tax=Arthroderma uncinatum TaxID=74035 RepID=UPI00144AC3B2|nr:anion exchange family protein [Arthroderma uncinatum]KAF3491582.1 anion exchange family protein [Arthroderma uncinatum]
MSRASISGRSAGEASTASMNAAATESKWWKIRFFHGMKNDIKRRAPYYWSDWKDAWDYRVVPATVYMYFAKFSCDIFGFYVAFIYIQKGIQVLTRQWGMAGETSAYLSITVSLLVFMSCFICGVIGESNFFNRHTRKFIEDYGTPLSIIFFTGFVHIGQMKGVHIETLPTSKAFFPTTDRGWLVHFWDIGVGDIFLAIPFAILLTILFYFDHNVSALIAQGTEFPLRKPAGFHWDIFLLGLTTGIAGILGIPFPNGLIPQAPFHTASLCVTRQIADEDEAHKGKSVRIIDHVVEQRVSNLAQGLLTLGTMSGPLLVVLHLIPQGVMAGLFFIMGIQALLGNGVTQKVKFLLQDKELTSPSNPLLRIERRKAIWAFVSIELLGFGATFAITQTIAAIGFPVFILLLIPIRSFVLPNWFTPSELSILDAPTASPFTMESVGGTYGHGQHEAQTHSSGVFGDAHMSHNQSGVAVVEGGVLADRLENGELHELQSRNSMRRRSRTDR